MTECCAHNIHIQFAQEFPGLLVFILMDRCIQKLVFGHLSGFCWEAV